MPAGPGRKHEAVLVREGDMEAEIDVKIAPLVREIWRAGIETYMSCQEDGFGLVWLEFPGEKELLSFLGIVVDRYEEGRDSLYNRSVGEFCPTYPNSSWEFDMRPLDYALHDECGDEEVWHEGEPDIAFLHSVRFPPADLPLLLRRLRKHNARRNNAA
jgi:hypothetical protein